MGKEIGRVEGVCQIIRSKDGKYFGYSKDDDKLTESQEKIREKIIDIIIGKTKRYYGKD